MMGCTVEVGPTGKEEQCKCSRCLIVAVYFYSAPDWQPVLIHKKVCLGVDAGVDV